MLTLQRVGKLAEGKTKIVWLTNDPGLDDIQSKDDITAGDGKKHDVLTGKDAWSNTTTCNVFRLLKECGIPVTFQEQTSDNSFAAKKCWMIPLEVVVRREAHGSYLIRNPHLQKGQLFPRLVFELFMKTSGKKCAGQDIPCDDPMIVFSDSMVPVSESVVQLFDAHKPIWEQKTFLKIPLEQFYEQIASAFELNEIEKYARKVFLILEKSWQLLDQRLVDFKLEFARTKDGQIVLADVIDSDSWRKLKDGKYSDKQVYRDDGPLAEVAKNFREAAELSGRFGIPRQQIIIWTGSKNDNSKQFIDEAIRKEAHGSMNIPEIVCSGHKESIRAYCKLHRLIQNIPDSVLIAYIGMSNGAGPTLSANCVIPVITIPATTKEFPEDVWSSLRTPSDVPVMTVLEPKNAVLAALQILAMRNPALYANLRYEQEKRLVNIAIIDG